MNSTCSCVRRYHAFAFSENRSRPADEVKDVFITIQRETDAGIRRDEHDGKIRIVHWPRKL